MHYCVPGVDGYVRLSVKECMVHAGSFMITIVDVGTDQHGTKTTSTTITPSTSTSTSASTSRN